MQRTIFPGKVKVLPGCVFRRSDPAIVGIEVLAGIIRPGYPLMRADGRQLGEIMQIQSRGKPLNEARKGDEVAISIRGNVMVGRHFGEGDVLYTDPSEGDLDNVLTKFRNYITPDMIPLIKEIIKIKQRKEKGFGLALLLKIRSLENKRSKT